MGSLLHRQIECRVDVSVEWEGPLKRNKGFFGFLHSRIGGPRIIPNILMQL
jgi:hypothetical protein